MSGLWKVGRTSRRTLKHVDKVVAQRLASPVDQDPPHFLFVDPPKFEEHQLCVTPYEGHLADLKLAEWGFAPLGDPLVSIDVAGLQLEPQS